jgi:hypothetical protein
MVVVIPIFHAVPVKIKKFGRNNTYWRDIYYQSFFAALVVSSPIGLLILLVLSSSSNRFLKIAEDNSRVGEMMNFDHGRPWNMFCFFIESIVLIKGSS